MYIVSETFASDDPKLLPGMERMYSHWVFSSYSVPDELRDQINLDDYDAIEVTESVAKAVKFGNVNNGRIGLRAGTSNFDDVFVSSTEPTGTKVYYHITPEDEANTIEALKAEMLIYLKKHYEKVIDTEKSNLFRAKKELITKEINDCNTLIECQKLMHFKFGLHCSKLAETEEWGPATYDLSDPGLDNWNSVVIHYPEITEMVGITITESIEEN